MCNLGDVSIEEVRISLQDIESMEEFTKAVSEFDYSIFFRLEGDRKETQLNAKSILLMKLKPYLIEA
mgnify:CR=1 FL=1